MFRVLRTGAPWRDLPPDFGHWNTACIRCHRWRQKGVWAQLLEAVIDEPDLEWLMIDASYVKAHQHSASAVDGNQAVGRTKGAPIPNAFGGRCTRNTGQFAGHGGAVADCTQVVAHLLADWGYDIDKRWRRRGSTG